MTVTVVTVLKTGGEYKREHVWRLRDQVSEHSPRAIFRCLSDVDVGEGTIPLIHGWDGWWSKIELFRPGLFDGKCLYLDLDTTVVADITPFAGGPFRMLRDFYRPIHKQSGVMAWDDDAPTEVYEAFRLNPNLAMERHRTFPAIGDGGFIHWMLPDAEVFGDGIVSHKVHCQRGIPENASIVCFHGKPKPWDLR